MTQSVLVLHEGLIRKFKFWDGCDVEDGMVYQGALYKSFMVFEERHRQAMFNVAEELSDNGDLAVITKNERVYILWVCIVSPEVKVKGNALQNSLPKQESSRPLR